MKRILAISVAAMSAAAYGQSFNVDFNAGSGAGAGAPTNTFKGAAGQAGTWNAVGSSTNTALVGLNGAATSVTLTRTGGGTIGNNSTAALSGDDEKLLEDAFTGSSGVTVNYSFNNLSAGTYALYTYAIDPASSVVALVNVAGSTSQSDQDVGSFMSGPSYFVGATHALHVVTVGAGGSITASIAPTGGSVDVAGLQLVKLPASLLRIYVDDSGAGSATGSSWADAFNNPVKALSTAFVAGGQNCEVWVANGFYEPTTGTDRYASFDIPSRVKFYGGFAGTETSIDQRGLNLCYLNGNIGDNGLSSDNCYVVVDADLVASDTLIDGFRIHNGYNNDGGISGGKGGGMSMQGGSATVRNCTFVDNYASQEGGGFFCDFGQPTLVNCLFYQNEAFAGSAVYHSDQFPIRMYNCEFVDNYGFEGTVHFAASDGVVANGYFHGNYSGGDGGAVHADDSTSQVTLVNCTIAGNSAGGSAGGVFARDGADVTIQNSILWANNDPFSATTLEKQYDTFGAGSTVSIVASTVQGAAGNPGLDPLFVDGDGANNTWGDFDDNCRLQAASPCINLGGNAHVPADLADLDGDGNTAEQLPFDFDGDMRIADIVVDRGAFEVQVPCPGDLDNDGSVGQSDLALLLSCYNTAACGDIDGDNDTDQADLAALLAVYGTTCQE